MSFPVNLDESRLLIDVSLWSADLAALGAEIDRIAPHADLFHFDVADSRFVPGLVFFPDLMAALRPRTRVPFHAHLMAESPAALAVAFADAGADLITVHAEVGPAVRAALTDIRSRGKATGVALRADTEIGVLVPFLDLADAVVMIGTPLGTKGTSLSPDTCARIVRVRRLLAEELPGQKIPVLADGGIRGHTAVPLARAGADGLVAGSVLLGAPDLATAAHELRSARGRRR
jgi:ribulose-phosphate 3-epimerase